jgi:hypothetical protein
MSILKEILQSQEECLHSMSVCKDMVSTISTSSLATFNATNIITHTPPHYHQPLTQQQPQPNIPSTPFNHQSPLSISPNLYTHNQKPMQQQLPHSLHNTQHSTFTATPTHFPTNHNLQQLPHKTSPPQNQAIIPPPFFLSPLPTPPFFVKPLPPPQHIGLLAGIEESSMTMQHNQDNTNRSPISNPAVTTEVVERFSPGSLYHPCFNLIKSFSTTTTSSTELRVARTVVAAERPPQHSRFFFDQSIFPIHIFDPGGTFIAAVCSAARRHQIQNFRNNIPLFFPTAASSLSHHVSASLFSLLWLPWDRGKKLEVLSFRSPATIDGDSRHILSLLWLPRDRGKFSVWNGLRLAVWAWALESY